MTATLPLKLIRIQQTEHATFGLLQDADSRQLACTLELPWRENAHNTSCIPAGSYTATRRYSPAHAKDLFWIDGVPGRGAIEIHVGNTVEDTKGCVLLGLRFGSVLGERGVLESKKAFDAFMKAMEGVESFTLDVMDPFPVAA